MLDGIVKQDLFVNSPKFDFPGLRDVLRKYQAKAPGWRSRVLPRSVPRFDVDPASL
jgi:hypothetical protein